MVGNRQVTLNQKMWVHRQDRTLFRSFFRPRYATFNWIAFPPWTDNMRWHLPYIKLRLLLILFSLLTCRVALYTTQSNAVSCLVVLFCWTYSSITACTYESALAQSPPELMLVPTFQPGPVMPLTGSALHGSCVFFVFLPLASFNIKKVTQYISYARSCAVLLTARHR